MKLIDQVGWRRWLAAALMALPQTVMAQPAPAVEPQGVKSADPSDRLAANLVILSQNPRDVTALTEAGLSAIAVGDGDAALAFLARAEDIAPGSAKIKAAIGSALVLKQKPTDALRLFSEATALGMSEQSIARDRGLAYDLRGEPKRAQRDYALALRSGPDDELTIRYALSLGISGDDQGAMELLDPLLRQKNRGAWRARAFVLAMAGDVEAAEGVANAVMPGGAGASMAPFLRRLATLDAAERALAVNFGIMPSDASAVALASAGDNYRPAGSGGVADGLIPAGDPLGPRAADVATVQRPAASKEPRRIPGRDVVASLPAQAPPVTPATVDRPQTAPVRPAPALAGTDSSAPEKRPSPGTSVRPPSEVAVAPASDAITIAPKPSQVAANTVGASPQAVNALPATPPSSGSASAEESPSARFEIPGPAPLPAPASGSPLPREQVPQKVQPLGEQPRPVAGLGGILAGLEVEPESAAGPLPTAAEIKAARIAAQRKSAAEAKAAAEEKAARDAKEAERLAAAKHPARIWVQVATGANDAGLPGTWKKLKEKSPTVFKGQNASSVPFKATNRLLIGPFKSQSEARAMVNAMNKAGLQGSTFASDPGQVVTKVSGK